MIPFESESRVEVSRSLRQIASFKPPIEISDVLESKLRLENYRGEKTKRMTPRIYTYYRKSTSTAHNEQPQKSQPNTLLQQRIHEQNLIYVGLAERGFIPPPWKAYGRRHREEIDALRRL